MAVLKLKSHAEQVADFLREELRTRRWVESMPGVLRLEKELGVNRNTLEAAMGLLQRQGWLEARGAGRRRRISVPKERSPHVLRVGILPMDRYDVGHRLFVDLQHRLAASGHSPLISRKSIIDLRFDLNRIARFVHQESADAWVVVAGTREILEWFRESEIPAFALFGRRTGIDLPGAGPDKAEAMATAVERMVELGHRRIVLINHRVRRIPEPGRLERLFLEKLTSLGLPTGSYNMPDWDDSASGFHDCLQGLFRHTPPTALIVDESRYFLAAQQFCGNHGLRVPADVSLVSTDADPIFELFQPSVAHIHWDESAVSRQVVRWANALAEGRTPSKQSFSKAKFIAGGTLGPAPSSSS